jgi:diacylglycerol kinase
MNNDKNMTIRSRGKSFSYAINGLVQLFRLEPNAKLHTLATTMVIIAGFARHIGQWQWVALVFAIGLVWITEAINTCIEKLCDFCCENKFHPSIKIIKDIAAAAVLLAAMVSLVIAIIVFVF